MQIVEIIEKMSSKVLTSTLSLALLVSMSFAVPAASAEPKAISAELAPLLEKGYDQMKEGSFSGAVKTLTDAVKLDGDSITARRYLAYALVRAGQPLNSIKQLNLIVKQIKPTYFEWCTYGEAYLAAGGVSQAQNCYEQALKVAPASSYAKSGLIRVNVKSGNFSEALEIAEKGMKDSKTTTSYEYFKDLYAGVRSQQLAHGGSSTPAQMTVPDAGDAPAAGGDTAKQSRATASRQQQETERMLKRITSTTRRVTNHPGG